MASPILKRTGVVAGACILAGAAAGIAGSAAAPSKSPSATAAQTGTTTTPTTTSTTPTTPGTPPPAGGRGWGRDHGGHGGPAVHSESVELDKAGKAFITVTRDAGTVTSVSGDELKLDEAVGSVDYKTVTIKIPADATISRNGATATLSDLAAKDEVVVTQSSDGTTVWAHDAQHDGPGRGGPGGPRGHDRRHP
ncbi:MAG: hypothetical protein QOH43_1873 [Solirubrobacteraceae bacterium]|nr:hypothetical protein [Solirubrobacteraceae bacterium]